MVSVRKRVQAYRTPLLPEKHQSISEAGSCPASVSARAASYFCYRLSAGGVRRENTQRIVRTRQRQHHLAALCALRPDSKAQGDEPDIFPSGVHEGRKSDKYNGITPDFSRDPPLSLWRILFIIAIFKNSAYQNGIFAICSLRMLLVHQKRKLL